MPLPTIQRSWIEIGGNPARSSNFANYANLVNNMRTTWARCRSAIMRIAGRGGPAVPASQNGVHLIPQMRVYFTPPVSGLVQYPFYTHSITFPSAWDYAKLFRVKDWDTPVGLLGYEGTMGFIGPFCYTFYNPSPNNSETSPLRLHLEAYNMPSDPYYNFESGEWEPNPYGARSNLDDSEVRAYWVGSTIETSVGNFSLTYDALDADSNTSQNTGVPISYGTQVTIYKVNI